MAIVTDAVQPDELLLLAFVEDADNLDFGSCMIDARCVDLPHSGLGEGDKYLASVAWGLRPLDEPRCSRRSIRLVMATAAKRVCSQMSAELPLQIWRIDAGAPRPAVRVAEANHAH